MTAAIGFYLALDAIDRALVWVIRNVYESNPVGRAVIRAWELI